MDAADFKTYVFPLLFFKRISDVHDEEYQAALAEAGGDEEYARFPQNYRFRIPEDCHWADVRTVAYNVGQAVQKAMRGIEKGNPETLCGIFGDAQWTNQDRLPDSLLTANFNAVDVPNMVGVATRQQGGSGSRPSNGALCSSTGLSSRKALEHQWFVAVLHAPHQTACLIPLIHTMIKYVRALLIA